MGRKRTVEGAAQDNIHTFYCAPSKWIMFKEIAKSLGMNASELLRQDIDAIVAKYSNGELQAKFDYNSKTQERLNLDYLENRLLGFLKKEILHDGYGDASVYDVMAEFALSLGTDQSLTENINAVITKLKEYDCNGSDRFQNKHLITFIHYLETVVKRRNIETEIKRYWRQNQKD